MIQLAFALFLAYTAFWLVALKIKRYDRVDPFWAWTTGLASAFACLSLEFNSYKSWVVAALLFFWGTRLGLYLYLRGNQVQDRRYQNIESYWGKHAWLAMLIFYWLQAFISWILAWSSSHSVYPGMPFFEILALCVVFLSLWGEARSDAQLQQFKKIGQKNEVCRVGWWAKSRHPNYFFEWLFWCSFPIAAIGQPYFYWTLIAPVLMYLLLTRWTGIPYLEEDMVDKRGEAYRQYQKEVPVFFPKLISFT